MQQVEVETIESNGVLHCRQKVDNEEENPYSDFLASLNTYFDNKKKQGGIYQPEVGQLCAARYTGKLMAQLWYRCRIIEIYKSSGGFIGKLLLVDEGKTVCVTKARMRPLPEEFETLPHQIMQCVLNDLAPVTLGASLELNMSLRKSWKWDSAAIRYLDDLVKDSSVAIKTVKIDEDGLYHVVLYVSNDTSPPWKNVNELLIKENYAALEDTDNSIIHQQKVHTSVETPKKSTQSLTAQAQIPVNRLDQFSTNQTPADIIDKYKRKQELQKQKHEQEQRVKYHANKQVQDLLRLLDDDGTGPNQSSGFAGESSATSDLSDMETTPAPKMVTYKHARPARDTVEMLSNKFGKETADLLKIGLGISSDEKSDQIITSPKRVSFSPQNQVYDMASQVKDSGTPLKPFSFAEGNKLVQKENASHLVDASYILNALSTNEPSLTTKSQFQSRKYSPVNDVMVYGKLKRKPFLDIVDLDLPLQLKSSLKAMGVSRATPFQLHMWSNILAFKDVVGIAEANRFSSSKVLSYVLPILKNLLKLSGVYKDLGPGNGPYVVICVAGWNEAQCVYDICETLTELCRKSIRIDVRYGGMDNEEDRNIRLLNGCDILITTVPTLNKMLEANYTNLERICHIIFDDADVLVERFTEEIKILMRNYAAVLIKNKRVQSSQVLAVGMKWSYGIHSLMNSYCIDPLVIIANKIEAALFAKVPIVVELCNSSERLDHLVGFLETDAVNENTIVFTNSAKAADDLQEQLINYSISANVITDFTSPNDLRQFKQEWSISLLRKNNVLLMSDNAVLAAAIQNATCVVHYDYPQKKSEFGNRLGCLIESITNNELLEKKKELLSHVFVTEQDNGMRYSTGLVKLLKRSGQHVPELLQSMALSSRELKEEQKQFYELCPRLKLFGECSFIDDCLDERHTIFPDKDLLGLCPTTGFIKVLILDVISASNFWGRIIEHRLPYDPNNTAYDTTIYANLTMDLQLHYTNPAAKKLCSKADKYDVCVIKTFDLGYQRVRIEKIIHDELERPKEITVFGIDSGFTKSVKFGELLQCHDQFKIIPPQAVEIIACCVKPIEDGISWTFEASHTVEKRILGHTLEGRVQFSLQNTIWVDPLVEKEVLSGIQAKTHTLDIGRDLIKLGYATKNLKHVENLRKLLYDVQGYPMEMSTTAKKSLPVSMVEHETAYLQDNDYEDVYVSAVVNPGLFFVQRLEQFSVIQKLDDKIDATMAVKKLDPDLSMNVFPIGYICVAKFTEDKRWYRAKIVGISLDQTQYDVFYVDHGDREWLPKNKVAPAWADIIILPFQAIECSFTKITPIGHEWTKEDGDTLWFITEDKLLSAKVFKTSASEYIVDTINYDIELYDTTGQGNRHISHELVFTGAAHGSLQCLQEMFPYASVNGGRTDYQTSLDKCPDLCVEIYQLQDINEQLKKADELQNLLQEAPRSSDVLIENGTIQSVCKLLELTKHEHLQIIILTSLQYAFNMNERLTDILNDHDIFKILCNLLKKAASASLQITILEALLIFAHDTWYHLTLHDLGLVKTLCKLLHDEPNNEVLSLILDSFTTYCYDNEDNCATVRQEDGLEVLCKLFREPTTKELQEKCAVALHVLLESPRNQDYLRDIGGLQDLSSLLNKKLTEKAITHVLQSLLICMDENVINREYLFKINAHENLQRCAMLPIKYSMQVRKLFNDVIKQISSVSTSNNTPSIQEIMPSFRNKLTVVDDDEKNIKQTASPITAWSQHSNTVTLSVQLRGVRSEVTNFYHDRVKFRTVQKQVEYILDLELFDNICPQECKVKVKGGEVIIKLRKEKPGEEWSRLTKRNEKLPYILFDFDRWDDPTIENESYPNGFANIIDKLPPPPKCLSYDYSKARPPSLGSSSSDESSISDSEEDEYREAMPDDYFKI